jgi:serine/threonine protein kinase
VLERLPWIAPECYEKLNLMSLDSDIYSFGICLWEIFSYGTRPYEALSSEEVWYHHQKFPCYYSIINSLSIVLRSLFGVNFVISSYLLILFTVHNVHEI